MSDFDVVVIGGGAAGLMCAMTAGNRGRRVVVLEGSRRIGKKILMSGGGRCNFTNLHCEPAHFVSANPSFCISALHRYTQWNFIALVEKHKIPYHEKADGQLFCDHSSKDIVTMLQQECDAAGVTIVTNCDITAVDHVDRYVVTSDKGSHAAASLVVATGGLSIPKMCATDFGYRLARQFGLDVRETRAALVPFTFTGAMHELTGRLSGVSTPATISCGSSSFAGDILFTHRGLSGPTALQVSSFWRPGDELAVDLLPGRDAGEMLVAYKRESPAVLLRTCLSQLLPKALVAELQSLFWPSEADRPLQELADARLQGIGDALQQWRLKPAATEGYRTAEVTLGGVDTAALSSRTMECKTRPGLYFVGEVVDVTGQLGGFNFQWAWASGHAAGEVV